MTTFESLVVISFCLLLIAVVGFIFVGALFGLFDFVVWIWKKLKHMQEGKSE